MARRVLYLRVMTDTMKQRQQIPVITCPTPAKIGAPVYTVIVFKGKPNAMELIESQRVHFDNERDARRFARRTTTESRTDWSGTGRTFVVPCASIFEDSPSRGIGRHVAEYTSRARARFLRSLSVAS